MLDRWPGSWWGWNRAITARIRTGMVDGRFV